MSDRQALNDGLVALGLEPDTARVGQLLAYTAELQKWNKVYNLTAIPAGEMTITHHLLDALAVARLVTTGPIIDIGSGAGLPGIPLAICVRGQHFTLLDSGGKKTRFLEHVRILLDLDNVDIVQQRAEDFSGQYKRVICRGLGALAAITRMTAHLLAPGGSILAMKGAVSDVELRGVTSPFYVEAVQSLAVPGIDLQRSLVVINRTE